MQSYCETVLGDRGSRIKTFISHWNPGCRGRSKIWPPKHLISPQQKPGWIPVFTHFSPPFESQVLKLESSEGGKAAAGQSDLVLKKITGFWFVYVCSGSHFRRRCFVIFPTYFQRRASTSKWRVQRWDGTFFFLQGNLSMNQTLEGHQGSKNQWKDELSELFELWGLWLAIEVLEMKWQIDALCDLVGLLHQFQHRLS